MTSLADSGVGSLRQAIADANPAGGDTINFKVAGTITLTTGELAIDKNLTISGPGAGSLAISGNNASRVFSIAGAYTVAISGVTIENANPGYSNGGGIANSNGTLTVSNSIFSGNSARDGGGIYIAGGTVTVTNSTFSGNSVSGGGGIGTDGGTLTVSNSTFSGNFANYGGGININYGRQTVSNSTFSGNSGPTGSGIANANGTLTVSNSTFSGNSGSAGIVNRGGFGGTVTVKNILLANSPSGGNCYGSFTSQGHNLSDDNSCSSFFTQTGDMNNTPAGLDPNGLQNNGGPTKTIALLASSPAVDAIPLSPANYCTDTNGAPVTTDQRGVTRPQGAACDIGAFEFVIDPDDVRLAQLNGGNTFTGNQVVNGNVNATNFAGNGAGLTSISPGNISPGTAAINISGTAAGAVSAGNAANLGGIAAGNYARLDIGNNLNGDQNVTGNLTTTGSVKIGGGTLITQHLSATFDPGFTFLKGALCASQTFPFAGASDGDTVALGVPNARMTAFNGINYSAWVSTAGTITIQACNFTGSALKSLASGSMIRVDVWKH